jgi:hypothetical protein
MKASMPLLALAAVASLTACAHQTHQASRSDGLRHLGGSAAKEYSSLGQLKAGSTAVIRVTATAASSVVPAAVGSDIPATVTQVTVDKVLWGNDGGATTLGIRQLGSTTTVSDDFSPLLQAGKSYVLFTTPFVQNGQAVAGQYVIVGDAGEYAHDSGGNKMLSPNGANLPSQLSDAGMSNAVGG